MVVDPVAAAADDLVEYPFDSMLEDGVESDPQYPSTSVARLRSVLTKVRAIGSLDGRWLDVRRTLIAVGGLKEEYSTAHAFNDHNHCDLTTVLDSVPIESLALLESSSHCSSPPTSPIVSPASSDGSWSRFTQLSENIESACLSEFGSGRSWCTCIAGAHLSPPQDAAHSDLLSRVAFKLVWVPHDFAEFILVDDEGRLLKRGRPSRILPSLQTRQRNYDLVKGGKYAIEADKIAAGNNSKGILSDVALRVDGYSKFTNS